MSSDIAIRVENLGKRYVLGRETHRAATLAGRVRQTLTSPFSWLTSQVRGPSEDEILWALKDVSFEVKRGEVLGVIGRNGAGKSTLLKILSRITEPTTGHAEIHGRIAALLEVGTGMHPELTGRENIYLNGTILGMRKTEIDSKFDEIVDFSGIERFLDTQVKRYSSGMRVRLGFAIAAHLEPEILVIDEVLAVGDAEFQKKCLGKMKDVAGHGRTVIFVSHNMAAVKVLCGGGIVLSQGVLAFTGAVDGALQYYTGHCTHATSSAPECDLRQHVNPYGPRPVIEHASLHSHDHPSLVFPMGTPLRLEVQVRWPDHGRGLIGMIVMDENGIWLTSMNTEQVPIASQDLPQNAETVSFHVPSLPLLPGNYLIQVITAEKGGGRTDLVDRVFEITVEGMDVYGTGRAFTRHHGFFYIPGSYCTIRNTGT